MAKRCRDLPSSPMVEAKERSSAGIIAGKNIRLIADTVLTWCKRAQEVAGGDWPCRGLPSSPERLVLVTAIPGFIYSPTIQ